MTHIFYISFIGGFLYNFCAFSSILTAIQFTLRQGFKSGLIAGMGSGAAQIIWICAAIGLVSMSGALLQSEISHYKLLAALLLFILAIRLYISPPVSTEKIHPYKLAGHISGFLTVFVVAISAPGRIIGYAAVLLLMGAPIMTKDLSVKSIILLGTITGVIVWWIVFVTIIRGLGVRLSARKIALLQKITAVLLIVLATSFIVFPALNVL